MDDGAWTTIVELQLRPGAQFVVITGTRAAFTLLADQWPATSGNAFWRHRICLVALDNRTTHEVARVAFIAAAREAGLWVRY